MPTQVDRRRSAQPILFIVGNVPLVPEEIGENFRLLPMGELADGWKPARRSWVPEYPATPDPFSPHSLFSPQRL
jgi:hypothetical protein